MPKLQRKELQEFITHEPPKKLAGLAAFRGKGVHSQDHAGFSWLCYLQGLKCTNTLAWGCVFY